MPRKTKDKYQHYDQIKQYYTINNFWANLNAIGYAFGDNWGQWSNDVSNSLADTVGPQKPIYDISNTNNYYTRDKSNLLNRGKRLVAGLKTGVREYRGPFKEILEAVHYVHDPNNGDLFELIMDQPSLARVIVSSIAGMPQITRMVDGQEAYIADVTLNRERAKALGEFYNYFTDYYKAIKGFAQVLYERQKAEAKKETGLDSVYAEKYASAIDRVVRAYDKLKSAADERYQRTDLTEEEKDLQYYIDPISKKEIKLLNNDLFELTSSHPNKPARNTIPVAIENFKAQSKAIKAGWPIDEARIMGILAEAAADAANTVNNQEINIKRNKQRIKELEKKIEDAARNNQDTSEDKTQLEEEQVLLKSEEDKLRKAKQAQKDSEDLYEKHGQIKNPTYWQRQDALKDTQQLLEKYRGTEKDQSVIVIAERSYEASEGILTDPYDFNGKTRLQQAEAMLKTLTDVNSWGRSSDNFEALKQSVEKLVEMARKYPEKMSKKQFQAYERQNSEVIKKINTYRKGKEKQQADYKAAHNGTEMPISEYTAKRINAVNRLRNMALAHISMNSKGYTLEYTGTPDERAMALYERRIRDEELKRKSILGEKYQGQTEGGESYDLGPEMASFCKSVYIEKMKERYQFDPSFTAEDFSKSLRINKIIAGAEKEYDNFKKHKRMFNHMLDALYDRINMADEDWMETYDTQDYVIRDDIPGGVGHDWVQFELKNYRAMYEIPEPSEEDYMSESESEGPEVDGSKRDKSEIEDFKIKEYEPRKSDSKMDESIDLDIIDTSNKIDIIDTSSKKNKSIGFDIIETDSKKRVDDKYFEIDFIVPRDNLAGKIFEAMRTENLRKNEDPEYLSIARDIADHAAREKLGANTKLPLETMMKMAKYLDKGCDNKKPTLDETTRWGVVCSAFNQYQQKDAAFEKNAGEFMFDAKLNPKKNYGPGYYKGLYYEALDKSTEEAGKAYQAKPDDQKLTKAVKNKAYQVLMTDMVEATFARAKGVTYAKINNSFDSPDNKKLRDGFIKDLPEDFKTNYEKLILDSAWQGTFNRKSASDACDKALAMTMDERKKAADAGNAKNANKSTKSQAEKQLDELLDMLKRDSRRVNQFREKAPAPEKSPIKK